MTPAEAIRTLECLRVASKDDTRNTAINMAIEALKFMYVIESED